MQIHELYSALEIRKPWAAVASCAGSGVQEQQRLQEIILMTHWQMQHSRLLHQKSHSENHLPACDQRLLPPKPLQIKMILLPLWREDKTAWLAAGPLGCMRKTPLHF